MPVVPMVANGVSAHTCRITRLVRGREGWVGEEEGRRKGRKRVARKKDRQSGRMKER